eukprot:830923-Rhodomonas_salina.3
MEAGVEKARLGTFSFDFTATRAPHNLEVVMQNCEGTIDEHCEGTIDKHGSARCCVMQMTGITRERSEDRSCS